MTLHGLLVGTGLVAGGAVAGLVHLDCVRRGMSLPSGLVRALACGVASFGGFLVPYVFSQELQNLYFQLVKPQPIAVSPREWLSVTLTTALLIVVAIVGLYFAGSRFQSRKQTETR